MKDAINVLKALSDRNRLRMLFALRHGDLRVCQLIELVRLAPSTVSRHLSILREAGLLVSRKDGHWVYCRAADRPPFPIAGKRAAALFQALEKSSVVRADDRRLRRILKMDPEKLCRKIVKG